ncbi:Succinate dehydrogenase assembly factor 1, mitochondrial [Mycena sanguinolenta]|uniref:Succinate dehydrogenase assembly factor 1, mitochondrial n=1 Tax=Mycena sanguinolenta TaxID=230812 RepID=A0A8H6XU35_9AGAR|nr:Succinate dehydrogenase assembly factor 1, mitochondrial [Mycena sanguinolenta]
MSARRSGLQKEVLNLYRRALRIPRTKPEKTRTKWDLLIRYSFRKNATSVSPRNISAIEHLLRVGGAPDSVV